MVQTTLGWSGPLFLVQTTKTPGPSLVFVPIAVSATGRDFDLPRHSHYSGVIPMVFQHSGGRDFDLPRHSHYSGVIPMVFQHIHSRGRDFDLEPSQTLPLLWGYPYGVSTYS